MEQLTFDMQLLLDIKDAAKVLNLSEDYLYRHWNELPFAFKIGKQIRFSMQGMMKYIENRMKENGNGTHQ